ncbi:MAG: hypothetical protein CMP47_00615 [Rickettsiales bacterium]|jgi:hypothetical protein|nr:hypothetical protein [Rickettsiales bacterium]
MRTTLLLLFVAFLVSSLFYPVNANLKEKAAENFHGFEYINQSLVKSNQVRRFDVAIFENVDDESPCLAFAHYFNSEGYITKFSPPMVGTSMVYKYDANAKLVDYGWDERDGSDYVWFSKVGKEDFDLRLQRISNRHQSYLNYKLKPGEKVVKRVISVCANIDGFYELSVTKIEQSLPKLIVAKLKGAPERSHLHDTSFETPKVLFIKLNYIIEVE